jgi:hypothetical protein
LNAYRRSWSELNALPRVSGFGVRVPHGAPSVRKCGSNLRIHASGQSLAEGPQRRPKPLVLEPAHRVVWDPYLDPESAQSERLTCANGPRVVVCCLRTPSVIYDLLCSPCRLTAPRPTGASLSQPQRLPPPRSSRRRHHGHDADSHSPNPVKCAGRLGRRKGAARPSVMGLRPTLPPPYGGRRRLVVGNGTSPGVIDSDDGRFGVDTARPSRARDEVDGGGAMSSADQVRRRDRMPEVRYGARLAPAVDARPHERADWLTG